MVWINNMGGVAAQGKVCVMQNELPNLGTHDLSIWILAFLSLISELTKSKLHVFSLR